MADAMGYILSRPSGLIIVSASRFTKILYNGLAFEDDFGDGVLAGM